MIVPLALSRDLKRNRNNTKGFLIVLLFRMCNRPYLISRKYLVPRILVLPIVFFYKLITDYIMTVYLPLGLKVGPGFVIYHGYSVVIHRESVIGEDVTVRQCVTIGAKKSGSSECPTIGNGVDIGAGAQIIGKITVGDGAVIGAGAVVVKDVPAGASVVGNPARQIDPKAG
jgi:putative colanic acid biosynthesis acetyltransferase WcaB